MKLQEQKLLELGVKALDSRHIVCFEAVIYELLVAKSKLTDHRVFDDPSIQPEKPVDLDLILKQTWPQSEKGNDMHQHA